MSDGTVTVRLFGLLRNSCEELGLPFSLTTDVPEEGMSARELALELGLDPSMIEGVFINHKMSALSQPVKPGDQLGYVPYGTPGPHRVYLGIYGAGKAEQDC